MNFLDNITDMAKTAMGAASNAASTTNIAASLSKLAEEIQSNPSALIQEPMTLVNKLKEMIPMDQLKNTADIITALPFPVEIKDGLTKLIEMAIKPQGH